MTTTVSTSVRKFDLSEGVLISEQFPVAVRNKRKREEAIPSNYHGKILIEHIKRGGQRVGTVVAIKENGKILIGWSKRNRTDPFSPDLGRNMAVDRAMALVNPDAPQVQAPHSLGDSIIDISSRSIRYFRCTTLLCPKISLPPHEVTKATV